MNSLDKMEDYDRLLERNAELERKLAILEVSERKAKETSDALFEARRKLAEWQAKSRFLVKAIYGKDCPPAKSGEEELTALLAKAKEEGRREAVPEGWLQAYSDFLIDYGVYIDGKAHMPFMVFRESLAAFIEATEAMLAAAPKPEGVTECQ